MSGCGGFWRAISLTCRGYNGEISLANILKVLPTSAVTVSLNLASFSVLTNSTSISLSLTCKVSKFNTYGELSGLILRQRLKINRLIFVLD